MKVKLTDNQKTVINILRQYPNDRIMNLKDGYWLTGGHGIKFDGRIVQSLRYQKEIIGWDWKLTELGKNVEL